MKKAPNAVLAESARRTIDDVVAHLEPWDLEAEAAEATDSDAVRDGTARICLWPGCRRPVGAAMRGYCGVAEYQGFHVHTGAAAAQARQRAHRQAGIRGHLPDRASFRDCTVTAVETTTRLFDYLGGWLEEARTFVSADSFEYQRAMIEANAADVVRDAKAETEQAIRDRDAARIEADTSRTARRAAEERIAGAEKARDAALAAAVAAEAAQREAATARAAADRTARKAVEQARRATDAQAAAEAAGSAAQQRAEEEIAAAKVVAKQAAEDRDVARNETRTAKEEAAAAKAEADAARRTQAEAERARDAAVQDAIDARNAAGSAEVERGRAENARDQALGDLRTLRAERDQLANQTRALDETLARAREDLSAARHDATEARKEAADAREDRRQAYEARDLALAERADAVTYSDQVRLERAAGVRLAAAVTALDPMVKLDDLRKQVRTLKGAAVDLARADH